MYAAPNLPVELISGILEEVYFPPSSSTPHQTLESWTPDRATLASCSLVCHRWRDLAQTFLFHEIQWLKPSFCEALREKDQNALEIATYVRRLGLRISGSAFAHLSPNIISPKDFLTILSACPSLYELTLRIDGMHAFNEDIMEGLRSLSTTASLASLTALNLMSFGTQSPIPYQLLSVMPGVRYLRLGTELAAPCPSEPCKAKLYELTLLRTPLNVKNVSWLLSASEGHLRVLEFRDTPGRSYDPLLSVYGSHLESFRVIRQELRSASIFKFCSNLKELIVYQFSDLIPIRNIPASVEHLSFRYSAWAKNNTLVPIIDALRHLRHLRLVSCNKETEEHKEFHLLRKACEEQKVKLCVDAPPVFVVSTDV